MWLENGTDYICSNRHTTKCVYFCVVDKLRAFFVSPANML